MSTFENRQKRIEDLLAVFNFTLVRCVLIAFYTGAGPLWSNGSKPLWGRWSEVPSEQELREAAREVLETVSSDPSVGYAACSLGGFEAVRRDDYRLELFFTVAEAHEESTGPRGSAIR